MRRGDRGLLGFREAHQGQAAWAASGVLGILKDFGYVPQVDVLGDVVGEEMGEDVALGDAQPGLRLTAERTLIHSLTPVDYDVVVEQAKGVIIKFTLELPDGPLRYIPLAGNSTRPLTIAQSIKDGQSFESRQWLAVGRPCGLFTQFVQFFGYRWFPDNRWDSTLRTSWRHSLPLSRRPMVVHCLFIRYARLIFSDSPFSLPV